MDFTIRTLSESHLDWFVAVIEEAFLQDTRPEHLERARALLEPGRSHALYDGERLVGGGSILTRDMTLPGVDPTPVAAVSAVGIAADSRRRGGLSLLIRTQLHELHESRAEPIAALWASEGGIYGRFGYGLSSQRLNLSVPRGATFGRGPATDGMRVRMVNPATAAPVMRQVHDRARRDRVGWINRPPAAWAEWLADAEHDRHGMSAFRYVVVGNPDDTDDPAASPGGYAVFRVAHHQTDRGPRNTLQVRELVSETPAAHAALWRFLLDFDFTGEVRYANAPVDDPLPLLLTDPRAAAATRLDGLWVRLVDLDRALPARRYAAECDLTLAVSDALCPWNAGTWRLRADSTGAASVEPSSATPDLSCDIADLGAAFLGDTRWSALAAAGRVSERTPGAITTASRAFTWHTAASCPEIF